MDADLITLSDLKARGWTDSLIRRFLKSPNETRPNPKYPNAGSPMKLYRRKRVERVEASSAFKEAMEKANARKASAQRAVQTKLQKMQDYLDALTIEVPVMEKESLVESARRNFYSLGLPDGVNLSTERMCVNFLRHCETKYEHELEAIAGKAGAASAYYGIKAMVLMEISRCYAWLADECDRQRKRLWEEQMQRD